MVNLIPFDGDEIKKVAVDSERITELRAHIRSEFSLHMSEVGYERHSPATLIPENDPSVLFTGSSTNTLKCHIEDGNVPHEGYYLVQSCIRTQNTKILSNDNKQIGWASYFSVVSGLTKYENLDGLSDEVWSFFNERLGIPKDRLAVRIASKDIDLLRHWERAGLHDSLEIDMNEPDYYTHKYGMDDLGIRGRNCNIAVSDPISGQLRDLGNVVVIEKEGRPFAAEIGFGVETIISGLLGLPNSVAATLIGGIVPIQNEFSYKLADAVSAAVMILDSGVRPDGTSSRGRVLKYYLRALNDLCYKANVSVEELEAYAQEFEVRELGDESGFIPAKIAEFVKVGRQLSKEGVTGDLYFKRLGEIFVPEEKMLNHLPRVPLL